MSLSTVLSDPFDGRIEIRPALDPGPLAVACDLSALRRHLATLERATATLHFTGRVPHRFGETPEVTNLRRPVPAPDVLLKLRGLLPDLPREPRPATPTSSTLTTALALVGWAHA